MYYILSTVYFHSTKTNLEKSLTPQTPRNRAMVQQEIRSVVNVKHRLKSVLRVLNDYCGCGCVARVVVNFGVCLAV